MGAAPHGKEGLGWVRPHHDASTAGGVSESREEFGAQNPPAAPAGQLGGGRIQP